jgi:hypothetical protein
MRLVEALVVSLDADFAGVSSRDETKYAATRAKAIGHQIAA